MDIDLALQDPEANFSKHLEHYDEWIQSGFAGKMEYLIRGRDRRADPRLVFPQAQSIFCVALPYSNQPAGASTLDQGPRYARYLQGPDYHLEIAERLEAVMRSVQDQWQKSPTTPELQWKVCVDSSAILERTWAALAGLGWIGKNTLLIHPHYGSYLFLAEVLINQPTGQGPHLVPNYCGHCTRCLSSCPTGALIQPGTLDSNQCIAYWTLEKRGDLEISASQKGKIKNWIAGCDLCQEACPFNRKPAQRAALSLLKTNQGQENATLLNHWIDLLNEIPSDYRLRVKNSALNRVKPAQFSRNLAITLTNTLTEMPPDLGTQLKALLPLIIQRENQETDAIAKQEWENCVRLIKNHSEKCL